MGRKKRPIRAEKGSDVDLAELAVKGRGARKKRKKEKGEGGRQQGGLVVMPRLCFRRGTSDRKEREKEKGEEKGRRRKTREGGNYFLFIFSCSRTLTLPSGEGGTREKKGGRRKKRRTLKWVGPLICSEREKEKKGKEKGGSPCLLTLWN